jgi:hypothetical protein
MIPSVDTASENKVENTLNKEKVESDLTHSQVDTKMNQQTETKSEEMKEDPNWRAFREARKKDKAEREAAEKRASEKEAEALALKAAMEAILNKNHSHTAPQQHFNDYTPEETEDERIEKKVQAAIAKREAEAERLREQREQQEFPQRLQQHFPDFNQTISDENQDYLVYHYPEVAELIRRAPEGYDKWQCIYKTIKKLVPNSQNSRKDAAKAETNFNKPKSMSSTGVTPPGDTRSSAILTEERRAANWARMQKTMKAV